MSLAGSSLGTFSRADAGVTGFTLAQRTGRRGRPLIRWRARINGHTWTLRAKVGYCRIPAIGVSAQFRASTGWPNAANDLTSFKRAVPTG